MRCSLVDLSLRERARGLCDDMSQREKARGELGGDLGLRRRGGELDGWPELVGTQR